MNLYTAKEQNVKAQIAVLQLKIQECEAQLAGTQAQVAAKLLEVDRSTQSFEARMKGMYEMSRQSGLAVLLGADSLSEMLTVGEYLQRIAVRDTRLIAELTARREELAALAARPAGGSACKSSFGFLGRRSIWHDSRRRCAGLLRGASRPAVPRPQPVF